MSYRRIKRGFSITEVLVVVAIIALLVGVGVPAAKQIRKSLESSTGVNSLISAALSNARAIALKQQKYAGVRFQHASDGRQYMTIVLHDPANVPTLAELAADPYATGTGLANGFRAVTGRKPMSLPLNVGVTDMLVNSALTTEQSQFTDMTTFSIVFSPAGKLVTHDIRIRNRHGKIDPVVAIDDDVFNTQINVEQNGVGLFVQDDYLNDGLFEEMSRQSFVIYDKADFAKKDFADWAGYLGSLERFYINPYSGEVLR